MSNELRMIASGTKRDIKDHNCGADCKPNIVCSVTYFYSGNDGV